MGQTSIYECRILFALSTECLFKYYQSNIFVSFRFNHLQQEIDSIHHGHHFEEKSFLVVE